MTVAVSHCLDFGCWPWPQTLLQTPGALPPVSPVGKGQAKGQRAQAEAGPPCTGHELSGLGGVSLGGIPSDTWPRGQGARPEQVVCCLPAPTHRPALSLGSRGLRPWAAGASDHLAPSCKSAPSPWNFRTLRPGFLLQKKTQSTRREFITKWRVCKQLRAADREAARRGALGSRTENTASAVGNPSWVGTKPAPGLAAHVSLPLQRSPQKASAACPARLCLCLSSRLRCQHCSRSLWEKMSPRTYTED